MPLSDAQIDRYSRQIILPEVGGRGQERLLAARVALSGVGAMAATAARYLTGAGIGELRLSTDLAALADELRDLNPDVTVCAGDADGSTTVVIVGDLTGSALDGCARQARALRVPTVAAARRGRGGWLHVATAADDCAGCAARTAALHGADADGPLDDAAAGVLGSLLALAGMERALGRAHGGAPLAWFDAATSMLTALPVTRFADCDACAPRA